MAVMSLSQFRTLVRGLDGRRLETLTRAQPFVLHVEPDALTFTLGATGKVRRESWNQIAAVLDRFSQVQSFQPGKYVDVTHNASCVLAVLKRVTEAGGAGSLKE